MSAPRKPVLLDVTLRLNGSTRRWSILPGYAGWTCRVASSEGVRMFHCPTQESAQETLRDWTAEIDAARDNDWK